jgi:CRISPR/Cas system-associated endonuclease Cas1
MRILKRKENTLAFINKNEKKYLPIKEIDNWNFIHD